MRRHLESRGTDEIVERAQWYVLIDDELYIEPGDELCHQTRVGKPLESYCSFFTTDYMASLFEMLIFGREVLLLVRKAKQN